MSEKELLDAVYVAFMVAMALGLVAVAVISGRMEKRDSDRRALGMNYKPNVPGRRVRRD